MDSFISGVVQNIAANIFVVILLFILGWIVAQKFRWRLFGAVFRLRKNGVSNIFLNRAEYISRRSRVLHEVIESAQRDFTYVGIYVSVATDQARIDNSIRALIQRGCLVTIVLLNDAVGDETIEYLEDHMAFGRDTLRGRVRHAKEHFLELRNSLAPGQVQLLDIRLHKLPLTASAFIIDREETRSTMLVDSKWYGEGREKSFGLEFEGQSETDSLFGWAKASFVRIATNAVAV